MNQSSSSSNNQNFPCKDSTMQHNKLTNNFSRYPFHNTTNNASSSCSSSTSSVSSIEAPKGCLRFILSHTSSSKSHFNGSNSNHRRPNKVKVMSFNGAGVDGSSTTTPNSAPNVKRSVFYKPSSQKFEKVKKNSRGKSGNGVSNKPSLSKVKSFKLSSGLKRCNNSGISEDKVKSGVLVDKVRNFDLSNDSNLTPLNKVASGSALNLGVDCNVVNGNESDFKSGCSNSNSKSKTPPVQASVSPEIQCGSSMVSSAALSKTVTPVCYGAGFVVSGVADKRKCRPRGILTVGEAKCLDCFDSDDESDKENTPVVVNSRRDSVLPLPLEASMRWLLSPCEEADEDLRENTEEGSCRFRRLEENVIRNFSSSPLSGNDVFSPDVFNGSSDRSIYTSAGRRKMRSGSLISGSVGSGSMVNLLYDNTAEAALCSGKKGKDCCGLKEAKSPFSIDSLSSGNIIQTPQSESSTDRHIGVPWLEVDDGKKINNFDRELSSVSEHLQMSNLFPKSHVSIWDPTSSSFQLDSLTAPSESIDLSRFQKILNDRSSWFSNNSTVGNVSTSQLRISWREGLASRIFEMDEFDSCRCLSDEEDDANVDGCKDEGLEFQPSPDLKLHTVKEQASPNGSGRNIFTGSEPKIDVEGDEKIAPQVLYSCAESISTDAGGLVRSEDSDWTSCYKNHLFHL